MRAPLSQTENKPPPPTFDVMRHYEESAIQLRMLAGFALTEPIDPVGSAENFNVVLKIAENDDDASVWSGSARPLSDGRLFVMLNANQTRERMNVTLLEEVAHLFYGHTPTAIGKIGRTFDATQEQEAYWTAAAVLLPSVIVAKAVRHRQTAAALATQYLDC